MPNLYIPPAEPVLVKLHLSQQLICDLFITAIESPAGSWLGEISLVRSNPEIGNLKAKKKEDGDGGANLVWYGHPEIFNAALEIKVVYDDPDDDEGTMEGLKFIKWDDICAGLQKMAEKNPYQFGQLMDESATNWDSNTADTFMQFIVLGEEVYG